jgi:hypothetical protein
LKVNLISLTMFLMLSHAMLGKLNSIIKTWNVSKSCTPICRGRWYIRRVASCSKSQTRAKTQRRPQELKKQGPPSGQKKRKKNERIKEKKRTKRK